MSAGRWKRHEREVAAILEGVRLPNSGKGQSDVLTPNLAVQVKTRKSIPSWLHAALDQAARDCDSHRLPVVVLCAVSQGHSTRRMLGMRSRLPERLERFS
ncbi:hypothetical protein BH24CHL4_BH24CHL4_19500 [soil metagenome]